MLLILLIIGIGCHVLVMKLLEEVFPASEEELSDIRIVSILLISTLFIVYCKVVMP